MDRLTLSLRAQPREQIVEERQSPQIYQQKVAETISTTNINEQELENLRMKIID